MEIKYYGGNKYDFNCFLKPKRVLEDLIWSGNWFQIVGAAKEKDLQPIADLISGTSSRFLLCERNERVGMYCLIS